MPEPTIQQLFDLTGRVALITGATGHLGNAMARALAEAEARVIVSSRELDRARAVAESLPSPSGQRHLAIGLDHMNPGSVDEGFQDALMLAESVHILVNNGHEAEPHDWTNVTPQEFTRHLANATGYFHLARLVRDQAVKANHPASIIMLGSMYGLVASYPEAYEGIGPASPVAYHTLKGGILQMTRHLAAYWARDRIRVNALSPGPFPRPTAPEELVERLSQRLPMQRMGLPHELKGALVFLASDASSFVTGHNLVVDGGWTAW